MIVLRDPAGDVGDLPGQRQRHRDGADGDMPAAHSSIAIAPVPTTIIALISVSVRLNSGDQAQLAAKGAGVLVDRIAHELVLVARRGRTA